MKEPRARVKSQATANHVDGRQLGLGVARGYVDDKPGDIAINDALQRLLQNLVVRRHNHL